MFAKGIRLLPCLLLMLSVNVQAEPVLQMHVFDQPVEVSPPVEMNKSHSLEMHVFDNSPALQNNAVVPDYKQRIAPVKKPVLTYERAEGYIKTGYRRDDLDWSISAPGGTPNVLSELKWKDIEIATLNIGATLYTEQNWLVNFDMTYGRVFDGQNQDSDYFGNNRTSEFSRSNNGADKGDILDISTSVGYRWQLPIDQQSTYPNIEFIPQIGLSYSSQNLKMVDGRQTVSEFGFGVPLGPISGLDTSYDATWFGPWLGLDSQFTFSRDFKLGASIEYHYTYYDATANWNLRTDFAHPKSFTHEARGYGWVGNVEGQLRLNDDVSLNLSLNYQDWQADRYGVDKTFFSDGSAMTTGFNGVNWRSFGANIGLVYEF